jgi:predicted ATPase
VISGIICLEEPENGIHPERVPVMLELLRDIAVAPHYEVSRDNPMRQVVVHTHSPLVVGHTAKDDLVYMGSVQIVDQRRRGLSRTDLAGCICGPGGRRRVKQRRYTLTSIKF